MYGYIYETTNLINGKKYIGKHKSSKFDEKYYGSGIILNKAINKYGKENFKVKILEEVETNQKDLDELETYYIKKFNAVESMQYYNKSYGGESEGWYSINKARKAQPNKFKVSDETRQRLSKSLKGRKRSKETCKKLSEAAKNRVHTYWINIEGVNKKVAKDQLSSYLLDGWSRGMSVIPYNKGKPISLETRTKISESLKRLPKRCRF